MSNLEARGTPPPMKTKRLKLPKKVKVPKPPPPPSSLTTASPFMAIAAAEQKAGSAGRQEVFDSLAAIGAGVSVAPTEAGYTGLWIGPDPLDAEECDAWLSRIDAAQGPAVRFPDQNAARATAGLKAAAEKVRGGLNRLREIMG